MCVCCPSLDEIHQNDDNYCFGIEIHLSKCANGKSVACLSIINERNRRTQQAKQAAQINYESTISYSKTNMTNKVGFGKKSGLTKKGG